MPPDYNRIAPKEVISPKGLGSALPIQGKIESSALEKTTAIVGAENVDRLHCRHLSTRSPNALGQTSRKHRELDITNSSAFCRLTSSRDTTNRPVKYPRNYIGCSFFFDGMSYRMLSFLSAGSR